MSEFYKMEPLKWDRGTDNLTLEQEAAYLRICNAIYAADQPIAANLRTLAGMWRCNERKAKRLLAELIAAGKVAVCDGWISNEKAMADVEKRRELRVKRQLAGHSGGIESGKSRAKPLEIKETDEANGSSRKEVEKSSVAKATGGEPAETDFNDAIWTNGVQYLKRHGMPEKGARSLLGKLKSLHGDEAVYVALAAANRAGSPDPAAYIVAALKPKPAPADQKLATWGIGDAQPVRLEPRPADRAPEGDAGAADMPRVQSQPEAGQSAREVPFGDAGSRWDLGALPSLRLVCGGAL